jgi:hypothetical protein
MSFDLAIWRRSPTTKTTMINEVYDVLGDDDRDHPAAGIFDTEEFVDAVCAVYERLPESDDELTWIALPDRNGEVVGVSLHEWTGEQSALVRVSGPIDALSSTIDALLPLVVERNLMLYDAQAQAVYNNRRQYPERAV